MSKDLKDKAIKFKGNDYVLVKDRVNYFNDTYPNGAIVTELVSEPDAEMVVIKATVTPDVDKPLRVFTDYSQARWGDGYINKTSAIENCSTSAVGRALAYMGIGVIDSIASADELNKASWNGTYEKPPTRQERLDATTPLMQAKGDLVKLFYENGITNYKEMETVIESVIGKTKATTLEEVEQVTEHLNTVKA